MTRLFILLLLLVGEARAVDLLRISQAAFAAGVTVDIASSIGKRELNPLLRSADGRFDLKLATLFKVAPAAGVQTGTEYVTRKNPKTRKALAIVNLALSGVLFGVAIRNWRLK